MQELIGVADGETRMSQSREEWRPVRCLGCKNMVDCSATGQPGEGMRSGMAEAIQMDNADADAVYWFMQDASDHPVQPFPPDPRTESPEDESQDGEN